ncbi:hypothetical protein M3202_06790 [Alkalihalobacillus oceani]|uniref:PepSY domain-containing protein n=1 Tax=Halalkalibacter oceani TaxID=1653776 RepID=A0A9X2DMX3_9BACI|nr:hypothetical protein [Halalkalibacter oceani]MCM3713786.1 hypothetical protein [Halalkalibacter oceani]
MWDVLYSVINHIQRYIPVSLWTLFLVGVALMLLSLTALAAQRPSAKNREKWMIRAGVMLRALLFLAVTLEFFHHFLISGEHVSFQYNVLNQIVNVIFYGYILVVGMHYLITLPFRALHGFFYLFDVIVLCIPILLMLPSLTLADLSDAYTLAALALIAASFAVIYVLFQSYWRQSMVVWAVFFVVSGGTVAFTRMSQFEALFPLTLFLLLLGGSEWVKQLLERRPLIGGKGWYAAVASISVTLIVIANPFYNLWHVVEAKANYYIHTAYRAETEMPSLAEMQERARLLIGEEVSFNAHSSIREDFYNAYTLDGGGYSIRFDSSGELFGLSRTDPEEAASSAAVPPSEQDVLQQTEGLLERAEINYDQERFEIAVQFDDAAKQAVVSFLPLWSDGERVKGAEASSVVWNYDLQLISFSPTPLSGPLELESSVVKLTMEELNEKVEDILIALGRPSSPTYIDHVWSSFTYESQPTVTIKTKNGERIHLHAETGELLQLMLRDEEVTDEDGAFAEEAKEAARTLSPQFAMQEAQYEQGEYGAYSWQDEDGLLSHHVQVHLTADGELISFHQNWYPTQHRQKIDQALLAEKDVSMSKAMKLVADEYPPFSIYAQRGELALIYSRDGEAELVWMIVVVPFAKPHKQVHFVDMETGEMTDVYDDIDGVRS